MRWMRHPPHPILGMSRDIAIGKLWSNSGFFDPKIRIPGSRSRDPDPGIQIPGSRTQGPDPGVRILSPGIRRRPGSQDPGIRIPGSGSCLGPGPHAREPGAQEPAPSIPQRPARKGRRPPKLCQKKMPHEDLNGQRAEGAPSSEDLPEEDAP